MKRLGFLLPPEVHQPSMLDTNLIAGSRRGMGAGRDGSGEVFGEDDVGGIPDRTGDRATRLRSDDDLEGFGDSGEIGQERSVRVGRKGLNAREMAEN